MNTEKFLTAYNEFRNGCNNFVRHPLARSFAYSDGVEECAEAGCYWLLDILAAELPTEFKKNEEVSNMCIVTVTAKGGKADIEARFTDEVLAWSRHIDMTDLPDGEWLFYIGDDGPDAGPTPYRMILPQEY